MYGSDFKKQAENVQGCEAICTVQQADWNDLPAFVNAFNHFTTKLQELGQAVFNQNFATPGVTKNKNLVLESTIEKAHIVANALRAFAAVSGDTLLEGKLDFPKSDFKRGGSQQAIVLVDTVLQLATSNLVSLSDFGVGQEDVNELPRNRRGRGERTGHQIPYLDGRRLVVAVPVPESTPESQTIGPGPADRSVGPFILHLISVTCCHN